MKKVVLPLLMLCLSSAALKAQDAETTTSNDYNKWSIDGNFGTNKAGNPMTEGYHMNVTNLFHADLGFRYMFNTKFGLKLAGGYDVLNDDGSGSRTFKSTVIGINLQGYANLGRIMEFETWTKRLNLLGHMGVGVSQLTNQEREDGGFDGQDHLGNFLIGLTGQFRISNRVSLNADFTMINNFSQHKTWDGGPYQRTYQGFDSTLYNATIGLSVYLGKSGRQHADWFVAEPNADKLQDLENRLSELETMMNDSDKDGVPDYLDSEPNTITGVAVDSKGRTIDRNNNGVPDELETYLEQKDRDTSRKIDEKIAQQGVGLEKLINSGYVNVYFDTAKDKPNAQSVDGINFLITYLKQNPGKSADVIGYADEVGSSAYNKDLSRRRAENVKKILVDAGVNPANLNIVANGEQSLGNDSRTVRTVVRRVTFILK
ncbi:flagellar motor protein MotB [Flavobacterium album]|uniref:Flagellar motor protein MotB n=1 Tax=Flavobacterium album TaxID=2175091 RepID=A0A2S1QZT3_9FLAO|nr:OmpA family protein [Flavobacterium album]AWH85943.1 flagellar motor protein MotB [Flavobacterium album]